METNKIKVYIKADDQNRITTIGSSIFIEDTADWIEIDEGMGDKYAHAQNQYLEKGLLDQTGDYNYKLQDDAVVERTLEEKEADRKVQSGVLRTLKNRLQRYMHSS